MQNKANEHKVSNLKEDDVVVDEGSGAYTVDSVIAPFMTLKQLISIKMPKKASYRISVLSTSEDWSCQRRPLAIVAALLTALSIAFLNASFAASFSEKTTRTVKQFSPHLAAKLRPPVTPVIRGRPSFKRVIHICGRPRWVFVFLFSTLSLVLWFSSCGLLTVLWALAFGLIATILHASFRTPNLKAQVHSERNFVQFGEITVSCSLPELILLCLRNGISTTDRYLNSVRRSTSLGIPELKRMFSISRTLRPLKI